MRKSALRTSVGLACLGTAVVLLLFGLAMCLWAAYLWLAVPLGSTGATALIGLLSMLLTGGMAHLNR